MTDYAIGDLQGCLAPLQRLLDQLKFDPASDTLWLVGDLVNRGPDSLGTLRFVRQLGNSARSVLGNHDLHLLAVHAGIRPCKNKDTLRPILDADDADELMRWLRHQPLLHEDPSRKLVMCHAGIAPEWTLDQARIEARNLEQILQSDGYTDFLERMYGDTPDRWSESLSGIERLRYAVNVFTRMRFIHDDGRLEFEHKAHPDDTPKLTAWYDLPQRPCSDSLIVFGHWSALGFQYRNNTLALDTGCVWHNALTAVNLDQPKVAAAQVICT